MNWFEDLPKHCPPADAQEVDNFKAYRFVGNNPPAESDFYSYFKLGLTCDASKCTSYACSVFSELKGINKVKKLPKLRDKQIFSFLIYKNSGVILKTSSNYHFSWWISSNFIIPKGEIISEVNDGTC